MIDRHARATLTGTALWALALALPAAAQAQADAQTQPSNTATAQIGDPAPGTGEQAADQADVVVTGTRIVRDGFETPTPLTVLTQQDILNTSPSNNIADFVNQLPSLAGGFTPANSRLNLSSGQAGINTMNLRNLGSERTLVLLDGRRSVASTVTGLVDVNTIPQALVKSVEVVTGGASSAYGSDAVAGVVNFVLDKKYTGLKVAIDSGVTDKGDGGNYSFSVAGGWSFGDGRGHLLLSGELAHRDGSSRSTATGTRPAMSASRTRTGPPPARRRATSSAARSAPPTPRRAASSPPRRGAPPIACAAPISAPAGRCCNISTARSPSPRRRAARRRR